MGKVKWISPLDVIRWVLGLGLGGAHCLSSGVCSSPPCSAPSLGISFSLVALGVRIRFEGGLGISLWKACFASLPSGIRLLD